MKRTADPFSNKDIEVPLFRPWITNEDKKAVSNALNSILLTAGPILERFEQKFAEFIDVKYAIGVSNATSALHLALKALGIDKGDEVIIPDMTFVATASAVLHNYGIPILADIDDDLNISIESIKKKITKKTRAILPVHFAGKICNINEIKKVAKENNLFVVEDCAHAIGANLNGKYAGTFGDAGCFSFYPTKNFTTIEGGMITTNSKKIADYVRMSRNHGITKSLSRRYSSGKPWDFDVIEPGYNYRLDEIRSALGLSQLKRIKKLNAMRKKACEYYNLKLNGVKGIMTPQLSHYEDNVYHLYIIRVQKEFKLSRDALFKKLLKMGIRTTVHYKPLHEYEIFKKLHKSPIGLENSKKIYNEILTLPLYPQISRIEQDKVVQCILN